MPPKPKLTPEEKKALRAAKKEEKKRRAEELKVQQKYDHLWREIKYGQETIKRHEKNWRAMLVDIAMPRMRAELEYAWHNFERIIDSKDFTISLLMDELKEAEEQYTRNLKSHMDNIDKLIILCYDQIGELWNESRKIITNLYAAATFERNDVCGTNSEHDDYLRTMLFMLETAKKESNKLNRGEYLSRQEVEISKLNEIAVKFTDELRARFEGMWSNAQHFLRVYKDEYAVRQREFQELTAQDGEVQKLIRQMWERIHVSHETMKMIKVRFNETQVLQSRRITELTAESKHFDKVYRQLKQRVDDERKMDGKILTALTLQSNEVMDYLREYEKKGERLLTLSALCRKYETLSEKTMAFPTYKSEAYVEPESKKLLDKDENEFLPELKMFWNRVAAAETSRFRLSEQCEQLRHENAELKKQIFQYCECLNCEPQLEYLYENYKCEKNESTTPETQ